MWFNLLTLEKQKLFSILTTNGFELKIKNLYINDSSKHKKRKKIRM